MYLCSNKIDGREKECASKMVQNSLLESKNNTLSKLPILKL